MTTKIKESSKALDEKSKKIIEKKLKEQNSTMDSATKKIKFTD